jgi:hypothetical protein
MGHRLWNQGNAPSGVSGTQAEVDIFDVGTESIVEPADVFYAATSQHKTLAGDP